MPPIPCDDEPPSLRLAEGLRGLSAPLPAAPPPPTAEQQAVIDAQDGTILVLAAVGSGKTTTLSRRIARALDEGMRPERMLALTFTNRAAQQLRDSLAGVVGAAVARRVGIGTFHALCNRVLRSAPAAVGLPHDLRVIDEDDALELMAEVGGLDPHEAKQAALALGAAASQAPLGQCSVAAWHGAALLDAPWLPPYLAALRELGAVDFAGLVYLTRALLTEHEESRARWSTAVDLLQVDEVQDTHMSEYEVLWVLGAQARSLCLVGDLDQTIYSFRGSDPAQLIARLELDFGAVQRLRLNTSFRCSPAILAAADALAARLSARHSHAEAPIGKAAGRRPSLRAYENSAKEAESIARISHHLVHARGVSPAEVAVLCRANWAVAEVARALQAEGLPATTAESMRFFRKNVIKDALALARLVRAPEDEAAAVRVCRNLVRDLGPSAVRALQARLRPLGLRIGDLLRPDTVADGDPLAPLLSDRDSVVLDTETTGLDPSQDEVIEVAAVRLRGGRPSADPADTFEALIQNSVPVGASEQVHHLSDARLRREGRPAAEVFAALQAFLTPPDHAGPLPIVGHNVGFDLGMLAAHAARCGLELPLQLGFDTLDSARRLLPGRPDHKLGGLVAALGLDATPTHRALDDVLATVRLIERLAALGAPGAAARRAALAEAAPRVERLRERLALWAAEPLRPAALLRRVVDEVFRPRLLRAAEGARARDLSALEELLGRVARMDRPELSPPAALQKILERATLAKDVEALDGAPAVRVLTMHQSKGLEFDYVFLPGLSDDQVPGPRAQTAEAIDEERRVLYVGMTRARLGLALSYSRRGPRGDRKPSPFLIELMPLLDGAPALPEELAPTARRGPEPRHVP